MNIYDQAQENIHRLDKQPSMLAEQAGCDLCGIKHDVIDMIICLDKGGYYCCDCFKCGDVESFLCRNTPHTKEEIIKYIESIKI